MDYLLNILRLLILIVTWHFWVTSTIALAVKFETLTISSFTYFTSCFTITLKHSLTSPTDGLISSQSPEGEGLVCADVRFLEEWFLTTKIWFFLQNFEFKRLLSYCWSNLTILTSYAPRDEMLQCTESS